MYFPDVFEVHPVADDESGPFPFFSEHVLQEPFVGVAWDAVYFVVCCHEGGCLCLCSDFEGREEDFSERSF